MSDDDTGSEAGGEALTEASLRALVDEVLPASNEWAEVLVAFRDDAVQVLGGLPRVSLQYVVFEESGDGSRAVRDIREQDVVLAGARRGTPAPTLPRLRAYLEGFCAFFARVPSERRVDLGAKLPYELLAPSLLERRRATEAHHFDELFCRHFGLVPAGHDAPEALTLEAFSALAHASFPWRAGSLEVTLGAATPAQPCAFERDGTLFLTVRVVRYEGAAGESAISDLREQEVWVVPPRARLDADRVRAFFEGSREGFETWVRERPDDKKLTYAMPCEVLDASLLTLQRAQRTDQFYAAYCRRRHVGPYARGA